MRVFIAGIMQGSWSGKGICAQDYRAAIADILRAANAGVEIVDPWLLHPNSVDYDREQARETFLSMNALAAQVDLLVAYVPQASMGTAIEMWEAYRAGVPVLSISPLAENWVVQTLSSQVFSALDDFEAFIRDGGLKVTNVSHKSGTCH